MVIGHYAIGFALKKIAPRLSLGLLMLGVNILDIMLGIFLFAGIEHARPVPGWGGAYPVDFYDYPITHSLVGAVLWSLSGFLAYWLWSRGERALRKRHAAIVALAIFSHFILDIPSHRPDLSLWGNNSYKLGFALYNSLTATFVIETIMLSMGVFLYLRSTRSASTIGKYGFAFVLPLMMSVYIWSLVDPFWRHFLPSLPELTGISFLLSAGQLIFVVVFTWLDKKRFSV